MKFGKHLLSSALPEWLEAYLDYKALKRAIKVQAQTGSVLSPTSYNKSDHNRCAVPLWP
jgi:SPX domain protein involved in polyphosphate accumulation